MTFSSDDKLYINGMLVDFERDIITDPKIGLVTKIGKHEALVLRTLLDKAGNVVSRDALLDKGWPGKFVSDNSLNAAIMKLRIALNDNSDRFAIASISGKGYELNESIIKSITTADRDTEENKNLSPKENVNSNAHLHQPLTQNNSDVSDSLNSISPTYKPLNKITIYVLFVTFIVFDIFLFSENHIPNSKNGNHKIYWLTPFTPQNKIEILDRIDSIDSVSKGDIYIYSHKKTYMVITESENILLEGKGNEK